MSVVAAETEELVQFLKNVKLFAELGTESLAKLGTCLKTADFPPTETIVREGAPGVSMYIIKSGLVEVRKKDPATGIDFLVAQLTEGAAVGEMSLLTGKPRSATVTTVQPTTVFTLTRADFRNLLTQHPEISLGLARILAERLEDATKQVGIDFVSLQKSNFDPRVVGLLPQSLIMLHKVVPVAYVNNAVTLAFLRQDPDVILVGETRDQETAKISVEAALTGHLVFTTLHTNDAPGSFTRLEEMGVEPFLMANSTIGIIAQRLARRIVQNCKKQVEVDDTTLGYFGYTRENAPPFFKGEGCDRCTGNGYKGRVGIYELLSMSDDLKRAVAAGAKTDEIRELAIKNGMKTLKAYAMILMAEGLTSVEEVLTNLVVEG